MFTFYNAEELRNYLAGCALTGLLARDATDVDEFEPGLSDSVTVKRAFDLADRALEEATARGAPR